MTITNSYIQRLIHFAEIEDKIESYFVIFDDRFLCDDDVKRPIDLVR